MKVVRFLLNFVAGIVGLATLVILAGHFGIADTVKPFIVQSGSMAPSIPVGSVVLVRTAPVYNQNDIITFHNEGKAQSIVTHRVVFARNTNGQNTYITGGDVNKDVDRYEVKHADIVGKVYFTLPAIGYAVDFAKTPKGFILLVIIPATIIVYEEIRSVQRELAKLFRRKNSQQVGLEAFAGYTRFATAGEAVIERRGVPKAAIIVPVIGAALVFVSLTAAYFFDHEQSTSNIMSAAVEFVTPTLTPMVSPTATPSATLTP